MITHQHLKPLIHLTTNPNQQVGALNPTLTHRDQQEVEAALKSTLVRAREYVFSVLTGDGKRPHCPYVSAIEEGNGYHVIAYEERPEQIDFSEIIKRLRAEFINLSARPTQDGQSLDITTIVAAFGHTDAISEAFCRELEQQRNSNRLSFLENGLMIAHMHPFHSTGSASARNSSVDDTPLYVAGIPLLMVRRMHAPDHVFMHTSSELAAYMRYFPVTSNMLRQRNTALAKRFTGHPFFKTVQKPEFQGENVLKTFMHIMLLLSRLTQECLRKRQTNVQSEDFRSVFEEHYAAEKGHAQQLEADMHRIYGKVDEFSDEPLTQIFGYFIEKMKNGTDPEKLLLSLKVLETAAAAFYKIVAPHIQIDTKHFDQHLSEDDGHGALGSSLLDNLSQSEYINLITIQKEGFDKIDQFFNRVNEILSS